MIVRREHPKSRLPRTTIHVCRKLQNHSYSRAARPAPYQGAEMKSVIYRYVIMGSLIAAALSPHAKTQPQKSPQELSQAQIRQREAAVFDALDLTRPELGRSRNVEAARRARRRESPGR